MIKGDNFSHLHTGRKIKVRARISCRTAHVVHLLKCLSGFYYVGKTKAALEMSLYRRAVQLCRTAPFLALLSIYWDSEERTGWRRAGDGLETGLRRAGDRLETGSVSAEASERLFAKLED